MQVEFETKSSTQVVKHRTSPFGSIMCSQAGVRMQKGDNKLQFLAAKRSGIQLAS